MIVDVEVGFRGTSVPFFVAKIYKSLIQATLSWHVTNRTPLLVSFVGHLCCQKCVVVSQGLSVAFFLLGRGGCAAIVESSSMLVTRST